MYKGTPYYKFSVNLKLFQNNYFFKTALPSRCWMYSSKGWKLIHQACEKVEACTAHWSTSETEIWEHNFMARRWLTSQSSNLAKTIEIIFLLTFPWCERKHVARPIEGMHYACHSGAACFLEREWTDESLKQIYFYGLGDVFHTWLIRWSQDTSYYIGSLNPFSA